MAPAFIRSIALESALGADPATHCDALRHQHLPRPAAVTDSTGQTWPLLRLAAAGGKGGSPLARVAARALDDAGLTATQRGAMPVFLGSTCLDMPDHEQAFAARPDQPALMHAHCGRTLDRLCTTLALAGPQYTFSTACSSAANALLHAQAMLAAGAADHALVLGVELQNQLTVSGFASLLLLTPDALRPFDADRDGLILGEAAGAVVLARTADPAQDWARLLGGASGCEAGSPTNSSPEFLRRIMQAALASASISRDELIAVKANGTGTPSNDAAEGAALATLIDGRCPITALKPYFGHTLGACGLIELIGLLMAWRQDLLPGTPGFRSPDAAPAIAPVAESRALPASGAILCNSFGFGGNTTSLVVQR